MPQKRKDRIFPGESVLLTRSEHSSVYRLDFADGYGTMTAYTVMPGVTLIFNDFHTSHEFPGESRCPGMIEINHCRTGRYECTMGDGRIIWLGSQDFAVSDMGRPPVHSRFSQKLYQGISLVVEPEDAEQALFRMLGEGGMDITPLRRLIEENIDEDVIRKSPVEFYSCTYSLTDRKEMNVDMKTVPEGQMKDMLLASAYLPGFKNEKLHGKTYVDGGATNVLPMDVLLEHGYQDLILLRIFGVGREKKVSIPEGVTITEIAPRGSLGNTLQFDAAKSRKNMRMGYYDALRVIYGLQGKIYYVEQTQEECYYLKQLVQAEPEAGRRLLEAYELSREPEQELRSYLELLLPLLAVELKLPKEWSYSSLYLAVLETAARFCKVPRYRVYTVQELLEETKKRIREKGVPEGMPDYTQLVLGL